MVLMGYLRFVSRHEGEVIKDDAAELSWKARPQRVIVP